MTAAQLKASILQLAIEGKLVEQDPADEPVSVTPYDGEVPFDAPENWVWSRLGDVCTKLTDGTHRTPKYTTSGVPFLSVKDMSDGKLSFTHSKFISQEEHEELFRRCNPQRGDILLTKVGTTGIPVLVDTDVVFDLFVSVALLKFDQTQFCGRFLIELLKSPLVASQCTANTRGVGNKNWVIRDIANTLVVLPPLVEQNRIVAKLEAILPHIADYGEVESRLTSLNDSFPAALKKSILQAAVQGKLVDQDPHDEPVDVPEFNGETPFDVPEGWKWAQLGDIGTFVRGNGIKRTDTTTDGVPCVRYGELYTTYGFSFTEAVSYVPQQIAENCKTIERGDVLLTLTGENKEEIGKATAFLGDQLTVIGGDLTKFTKHGQEPMYLVYFLFSPYALSEKARLSNGDIIVHISAGKLGSILIPLPPLAEQKRIVERVEELLAAVEG